MNPIDEAAAVLTLARMNAKRAKEAEDAAFAELAAIKDSMPVALFEQAIDYAPKLKLPGLRHLQSNEPDAYALLAQAITARPAKPSVRIEAIEQMSEAA
jgi:hypothetical protein